MPGTHRDLLIRSKSRCFASKNQTWGLGPIKSSNSDANHAVFHAQNDRWCLGPIEICYSGPKLPVLHAKATGEGWNQYSLFILVLSSQLCVLKTTDEVWDPQRLVILLQKSLFCMQKSQRRAGTHRYNNSVANYTVLLAQNDKWGLVPLKTCNSGPKCAVLHSKTTDEGWDT